MSLKRFALLLKLIMHLFIVQEFILSIEKENITE